MKAEISKTRLKELYLPTTTDFVFVDVPAMQFAMIDGEGNPDGGDLSTRSNGCSRRSIRSNASPRNAWERTSSSRRSKACGGPTIWRTSRGNKDKLKWRMMIVTADWVNVDMFNQAVATASEKLGGAPASLRLERFDEGRCVQIMHVGPYREAAAALARRLHNEFLPPAESPAQRASP